MNQRKLPSISNLLIQTPEWNVSPPSPTSNYQLDSWAIKKPTDQKLSPAPMQWSNANITATSPNMLSPNQNTMITPCTPPLSEKSPGLLSVDSFNSTVSPLLSPISSPSLSEKQLPPIHGDDPPRRLRTSTIPITHSFNPLYKRLSTGALDVPTINRENLLNVTHRPRSLSSTEESFTTRKRLSMAEEPVIKRKRGRPPAVTPEVEEQITFLTPTVWNIPVSKDQQERHEMASLKEKSTEDQMHDSMTAFSSFDMDTVLHMPRKKRGRKPKTLIHGNSCFIWKDLTSTRSK